MVTGLDSYNVAAVLKPAYKKITISVVDDKNQPLSNAVVTLKGNPDQTVNTTADGAVIFNVPNTEGTSMRSFSVKKDGYETFNMNLDINNQNSQIPAVTALKKEATTMSSSYDVSKPVNTFLPPRTNTPTMVPDKFPESNKIPVRRAGPFEPVCEPPLKGTETAPSWAVTEEKDFIQYLSDACLKPINDLITAILSLSSQYSDIAYEIPADKTSSNYVAKTIDKAKSLYEKMKKFDPSNYGPKCLQTGVLLYSIGEYKNYLTVEGTVNDVETLKKQLDEGIKSAEAKIARNEVASLRDESILSPSFWLQGWKILDGLGKSYNAAMSMLSKVVDPEVMMDYSVKALKALERANNMLNELNTTCKVYEADEEIKDALAKGRQAIIMARVAAARWKKRQSNVATEIDDRTNRYYPELKGWRFIDNADLLKPIWNNYQEWAEFGKKLKETEDQIKEIELLLRRIENACMRFASIVLPLNDRIKQYLELADQGLKAADNCDFTKAETILNQLKEIDKTECAINYFPRSANGGFPKSQELEMKITHNKSNPPCTYKPVSDWQCCYYPVTIEITETTPEGRTITATLKKVPNNRYEGTFSNGISPKEFSVALGYTECKFTRKDPFEDPTQRLEVFYTGTLNGNVVTGTCQYYFQGAAKTGTFKAVFKGIAR
ncbi:MAG: carboxypeptidase regulatory-like domain-containing protein [Chitinophagaceae bacterium]|nr:MAG: carboxypeptidase regulatory-like domain-containing protein [Chitinophagaceae bacterium]